MESGSEIPGIMGPEMEEKDERYHWHYIESGRRNRFIFGGDRGGSTGMQDV